MLAMKQLLLILNADMINTFSCVTKLMICCLVFTAVTIKSYGQEVLMPPFGLQWGSEPAKLMKWASDKKLDVAIKILDEDSELKIVRVESAGRSLPGHQARALEARYHGGKLFEVSVHYGASNSDPKHIVNDFNELKSKLAIKHGMFSPNNKQQDREDGFIRKSVSYHVEPVRGIILLMALSELEDVIRGKHSARFSLIYRNQNIIRMK